MTSWNLNLTEQTDTVLRTLAALDTEEPAVLAATLRAVADRLDPAKVKQPLHRGEAPADGGLGGPAGLASLGRDAEGFPLVHDPGDKPRCPAVHASGRKCIRAAHGDFGHKLAYAIGSDALRWDAPGGLPVGTPAVVDAPGDRMDAPDAVLSPAAARRIRITPDGCGPEHTFTGSCALADNAQDERINPNV